MVYQQIPLTSDPNQTFQVTLQINGVNRTLKFDLTWNYTGVYWVMRITDPSTDEILIDSVPLVTGKVETASLNILRQHGYLGIGAMYVVPVVSKLSSDFPTDENLGSEFVVIWGG